MWAFPEIASVGDMVRYHARKNPEKTAVLFEHSQLSRKELDQLTNQLANGLVALDVPSSSRVVFFGGNSDDYLIALFGTAKAACSFVPLNWRLNTTELVDIIDDSDPAFAFVERQFADTWQETISRCKLKVTTIYIEPATGSDNPFRQWLAKFSNNDPKLPCAADDTAWILYTSGTTGVPKGVQFSHGGIVHMRLCEHYEDAYDWSESDCFLFCIPNFHLLGIGLTVQAFYNGGSIAIIRQFNPQVVLSEITIKKPTLMALAPAMIQMLIEHEDAKKTDFSSIRELLYAGSAISLGLIKQAIEKIPSRFMQFYGSTEGGGAITLLRPEDHNLENEHRLTSCGKPLPLIDIKIVSPSGKELGVGEPGEMVVRTPAIAKGYWKKPEVWEEVYEHGWYRTGDVAYFDNQGFYYIVDRLKDMIVTGGENVYSSEIENSLSQHPGIQKIAAVGIPSERWGEEIKVFIIQTPGHTLTEAEVIAFSRQHLAGYKCPKSVDFVQELPMSPTGKVLKKDLRARYWQTSTRHVS